MGKEKNSAEDTIKTIRRKTRRQHSAEEKIRLVLEGLRGEENFCALSRSHGCSQYMLSSGCWVLV